MNDANASTQEATDKILDVFNKSDCDGKSKSSSSFIIWWFNREGGVGDGGLTNQNKRRKFVYKLLIDGGSVGAIGTMTKLGLQSQILTLQHLRIRF